MLCLTSLVTLASLVSAGTKTPPKDSKLNKLYKFIEFLGLVIHKAKDTHDKSSVDAK